MPFIHLAVPRHGERLSFPGAPSHGGGRVKIKKSWERKRNTFVNNYNNLSLF